MTLISLLLVLLVERITTKSQYWQAGFYADKYLENIESRGWFNSSSKSWVLALVVFVPVVIIYLVVQKFAGGLVELVISTAILMVCVGCPAIRATYKCFLQAANKGDSQACDMYEDQISGDALDGLIEEFITREGTDYGQIDFDLSMKVDQVRHQLAKGDIVIIFDSTTESVNLMTKYQYQEWS